jgi:hypothetical protein
MKIISTIVIITPTWWPLIFKHLKVFNTLLCNYTKQRSSRGVNILWSQFYHIWQQQQEPLWGNKRKAQTVCKQREGRRHLQVDHYMSDRSRTDWIMLNIGINSSAGLRRDKPDSRNRVDISQPVTRIDSEVQNNSWNEMAEWNVMLWILCWCSSARPGPVLHQLHPGGFLDRIGARVSTVRSRKKVSAERE